MIIYTTLSRDTNDIGVFAVVAVERYSDAIGCAAGQGSPYPGYCVEVDRVIRDSTPYDTIVPTQREYAIIQDLAIKQLKSA